MIFSIGNLLTLVVVLIILVIYRQIDRGDRSLEKVKKYADKMVDNLSSFVDEKTKAIKDFSIELQVNLKTGRELLKRTTAVEETLTTRADEIDHIRGHLAEYDGALKELVNMSERVDENLKRLQGESEFVDGVGKQITEMRDHLNRLESHTGVIEDRFTQRNREGIEALRVECSERLDGELLTLREEVREVEQRGRDVSDYVSRIQADLDAMREETVDAARGEFDAVKTEAKETRSRFVAELVTGIKKLIGDAENRARVLGEEANEYIDGADSQLSAVRKETFQLAEGFKANLSGLESEYNRKLADQRRILEETAAKGEKLEDRVFAALRERIGRNQVEARKRLETMEKDLEASSDLEREVFQKLEQLQSAAQARSGEIISRIEAFSADFSEKLGLTSENLQSTVLEHVEKRIADYDSHADYRVEKLEDVNIDIQSLEQNLRDLMGSVNSSLQDDMADFAGAIEEKRETERIKTEEQFAQLSRELQELSVGMSDLREGAYNDLSTGLNSFEEQFSSRLQSRNAAIEEKFDDWQGSINERVLEMVSTYAAQREEVEKEYLRKLKDQAGALRENTRLECERIEASLGEFRSTVDERIRSSEDEIQSFEDVQAAELEQSKKEALVRIGQDISGLRDTLETSVGRVQREVDVKLKELGGNLEIGQKEIQELCQVTRSEVTVWEGRVSQQLKESEAVLQGRIATFKSETEGSITSIQQDFASQRDDLLVSTNEERVRLRNELKEISDRTSELGDELVKLTQSSKEDFHREFDQFQVEYQRKTRDLSTDFDQKLKDFRAAIADIRDRADATEKKLFGKIEESYRLLSVNSDQIGKRLKSFTAQTKIFERADTLKLALESDVEVLKNEIAKVRTQRREVDEIAGEIRKTKRLADETTGKLKRFFAEKRQVEDMEKDFRKLLGVSKEIDARLETVNASSDVLQEIQAKVRALEDAEKIIESRYDRLEKRKEIIDSTTAGIDKNFALLGDLEKTLKSAQEEVEGISVKLTELENAYQQVSDQRVKADAVIDDMGRIDQLFANVEDRMGKLQSAREWLARTETRMENVGKQAQEQVRLLETLIQADGNQEKEDQGAPPLDKRETVIKLAHQGWTVQEIARATKLSRGEIELILEVAPKR